MKSKLFYRWCRVKILAPDKFTIEDSEGREVLKMADASDESAEIASHIIQLHNRFVKQGE